MAVRLLLSSLYSLLPAVPGLDPSHLTIFLVLTAYKYEPSTVALRISHIPSNVERSSLKCYGMNDLNCWFKLYNTVSGQENYLDISHLKIAYTNMF